MFLNFLEADRAGTVRGLRVGEAVERELVDQAAAAEAADILHVGLRAGRGLRHPVSASVVDCPRGIGVAELVEDKLLDQARATEAADVLR